MIIIVINNKINLINIDFKYVKDNIFLKLLSTGGNWDAIEENKSVSGSLVAIDAPFHRSIIYWWDQCGHPDTR